MRAHILAMFADFRSKRRQTRGQMQVNFADLKCEV
jgi:hypothetical protein